MVLNLSRTTQSREVEADAVNMTAQISAYWLIARVFLLSASICRCTRKDRNYDCWYANAPNSLMAIAMVKKYSARHLNTLEPRWKAVGYRMYKQDDPNIEIAWEEDEDTI